MQIVIYDRSPLHYHLPTLVQAGKAFFAFSLMQQTNKGNKKNKQTSTHVKVRVGLDPNVGQFWFHSIYRSIVSSNSPGFNNKLPFNKYCNIKV